MKWLRDFIKARTIKTQLKDWDRMKADMVNIDPLLFPAYYLKHLTDAVAIDRQKTIDTPIADVWDIILWAESVDFDLATDAVSNRIPRPGTTGVSKTKRVDKFLFCPADGKYVSLTDVMRRLAPCYESIALVAEDTNRVSHYRARHRVVPVIAELHTVLLSLLK